MITKKTVLVLGAGASMDFDFPSGYGLLARIVGSAGDAIQEQLVGFGYDAEQSRAFVDALRYSAWQSVDTFLEHRPEFVAIGKAAIAVALIPLENSQRLFMRSHSGPSWLEHLWARLGAPRDDWENNQLSVVTFNYDRTIEYFFFRALQNAFHLDRADAVDLLRKTIPIVHMHGSLGKFGTETLADTRPFQPLLDRTEVQVAVREIRVLHEGGSSDPAVGVARSLIFGAEELVFLGFGYDKRNIERLGIDLLPVGKWRGHGSAVGMTARERVAAADCLGNRINIDDRGYYLVDFLRNLPVLGR